MISHWSDLGACEVLSCQDNSRKGSSGIYAVTFELFFEMIFYL
jgi:hypothetical protein